MTTETDDELIGHYEMIDALDAVIKASTPEKRAALRNTIDAWSTGTLGDEFWWATSAQAPALLHNLMIAVDLAAYSDDEEKPRVRICAAASRRAAHVLDLLVMLNVIEIVVLPQVFNWMMIIGGALLAIYIFDLRRKSRAAK